MTFIPIEDGTPITPNILNRFVGNSGLVWKSSTAFSGGTTYNFDSSLDATGSGWNRIILSNMTAAANLNMFMQLRTTAPATLAGANYNTGMYQVSSAGAGTQSIATATTVYYLGLLNTGLSNYVIDIMCLANGYTNMIGRGNNQDSTFTFGGANLLTGNTIGGFSLTLFGGATVFSGKVNTYYWRKS